MKKPSTAIENERHGVHPGEQVDLAARTVSWDDLQILLEIGRAHSFRQAALARRVSVNTVRKRVERLEHLHGTALFRRSAAGVVPTPAGEKLIEAAGQMHAAALHAPLPRDVLMRPGEIRIGCSEAIGSIWLLPRLLELQSTMKDVTVSLLFDYDLQRDRSRELDISLQFSPPSGADFVSSRIATLHFMFYASRRYLEENGTPATLDDLRNFQFIEQVAPGVRSDFLDALIGSERPPGFVPMRTNSSLALFWAVTNDLGIAGMPTYVHDVTRAVVPIDLPAVLRRELHLVYSSDARHSPAVRRAIEWLKAAFDPVLYPWFRNTFVHPNTVPDDPARRPVRVFEAFEAR